MEVVGKRGSQSHVPPTFGQGSSKSLDTYQLVEMVLEETVTGVDHWGFILGKRRENKASFASLGLKTGVTSVSLGRRYSNGERLE